MKSQDIIIQRIDSEDDRRFYQGIDKDGKIHWAYPSVTTILDATVPKDNYLINWIRVNGIGGQAIFEKAAEDGTEVHEAIEVLLNGGQVPVSENMRLKVKRCIQAFIDWYNEFKPKTIATEQIVVNHQEKYAGGCDYICELDYEKLDAKGKVKESYKGKYVIDWKSSNSIQDKHHYQVAAYQMAVDPMAKAAIVHLGNRTKAGWSFKEVNHEESYTMFSHFNKTFQMLNPDAQPKVTEYPPAFKLNLTK